MAFATGRRRPMAAVGTNCTGAIEEWFSEGTERLSETWDMNQQERPTNLENRVDLAGSARHVRRLSLGTHSSVG